MQNAKETNTVLSLITPAKNEATNIPMLVESVKSQGCVHAWLFIDDASNDSTADEFMAYSERLRDLVPHVWLVRRTGDEPYALGRKYSSVVAYGIETLRRMEDQIGFCSEFVGVLDADLFPQTAYYERLIEEFFCRPKLGIASGKLLVERSSSTRAMPQNRLWAPGGCRVWRRQCLNETGYPVSISADAVSAARAVVRGWSVRSFRQSIAITRPMGDREGYEYYGKSMYTRGVPQFYLYLSVSRLMLRAHNRSQGLSLLRGYRNARRARLPLIDDKVARRYFRFLLFYRMLELLRGHRTKCFFGEVHERIKL